MPFIKVNNKSLFYTIDDNPTHSPKITILLIHGLGSSSCFYKSITPLLSSVSKCISLDTPGSGLSEHGLGKQTLDTIVNDVAGLLDALEVKEKVVVVGHSMGGIVASTFAARYQGKVSGVVLLGPVDPAPALTEFSQKRIEIVKNEGLEILANTIPAAATGSKSTPLQHAFIRSLILGTSPENYMCLCDVIANAETPDYGEIKVPLLILSGADDKTTPLSSSEKILKAYGTGDGEKWIQVLDGVGHWHCVEAPDEVARRVLTVLSYIENMH